MIFIVHSITVKNYFVAHSIPFESSHFFEIHAMSTMPQAIEKVVPPPCLTTAQWQSELRSICERGNAEGLRELCDRFRLKQKHPRIPFNFMERTRVVGNSALTGNQERQIVTSALTPLHIACENNNADVMDALLDKRGAAVVFDSNERTPFKTAVDAG